MIQTPNHMPDDNGNNTNHDKNIVSISMRKINPCVYTRLKYNFTFE